MVYLTAYTLAIAYTFFRMKHQSSFQNCSMPPRTPTHREMNLSCRVMHSILEDSQLRNCGYRLRNSFNFAKKTLDLLFSDSAQGFGD